MAAQSWPPMHRAAERFSPCVCRSSGRSPALNKSSVQILVVDDEKGLRAGIQEVLRREGYLADAVHDAETAQKRAEHQLFNLILTDMKLPGASGLELLRQIKAKSPDTVFILMTAYG